MDTIVVIMILLVKRSIYADYPVLTKEYESSQRLLSLKLVKSYTENWSKEILLIDSVLKANSWKYKIKDLNRKK